MTSRILAVQSRDDMSVECEYGYDYYVTPHEVRLGEDGARKTRAREPSVKPQLIIRPRESACTLMAWDLGHLDIAHWRGLSLESKSRVSIPS